MMVNAKDLSEAIGIGKGCPVLDSGGFTEVREIAAAAEASSS
jgi:hypothetical protein